MNNFKAHVKKTVEMLNALREREAVSIENTEYFICPYKKGTKIPKDSGEFKPFKGRIEIGKDSHAWIRFTVKPKDKGSIYAPYLKISSDNQGNWDALNPQGMLYIDSCLVSGLDINHTTYPIEPEKEQEIYVYFYSGMNEVTSLGFYPKISYVDLPTEKLYYDMSVPFSAASCFPDHYDKSAITFKYLEQAACMINFQDPGSAGYYESIEKADKFLCDEYYNKVCGRENTLCDAVSAIGHTHIDVAWLWTYAQTKEKAQRSFATVLSLMDRYPEYKFMSSQPQLYQYVKEEAPELYGRIKKAVDEGRWQCEGAMWVEADCNLISGESMVRQLLYGKRFFKEEFGTDSRILWLPDVFGYSAAMPQILKKAGVDAFVTSKISWNDTNMMPYDTFMWRGIDGTEIFSYFLTTQDTRVNNPTNITSYVGYLKPTQILGTWERYQQKDYNDRVCITYGYGDGGGGPTQDMLEQQRRLALGIPGIPKTVPEGPVEFIKKAMENFEESKKALPEYPIWSGELYLETHRGTYTTAAKNKKLNRRSEFLYKNAEAFWAFDSIITGGAYPHERIRSRWQEILLNQFHDVIPGSSIKEVYEDSEKMYGEIIKDGEKMLSGAIFDIEENINAEEGALVFNPNGFTADGEVIKDGESFFVKDVPPFGWKNVKLKNEEPEVRIDALSAENKYFKLTLNEKGSVISLYDKREKREVIKKDSCGARLVLFEDNPYIYDAWNVERYGLYKPGEALENAEITPFEDNISKGFTVKLTLHNSAVTQKIRLYGETDRIDFETKVSWNEEHRLLKAVFPFDINSDSAAYEIQYGYVKRPNTDNTSWDRARFETVGHKWADVGDSGFGVSVINDSKYGWGYFGNELSLSLLRAPKYPNPDSDLGEQSFTYSIYPHKGHFSLSDTLKHAYILNNPLILRECQKKEGSLPGTYSMINAEGAMIETVKMAEDSDDIIVRMYEPYNRRGEVRLNIGFPFKEVYKADLLENATEKLLSDETGVTFGILGFEIVTLKIKI